MALSPDGKTLAAASPEAAAPKLLVVAPSTAPGRSPSAAGALPLGQKAMGLELFSVPERAQFGVQPARNQTMHR